MYHGDTPTETGTCIFYYLTLNHFIQGCPAMSDQYCVWRVRYKLAIQDPEMKGKRYHNAIFVETSKGVGTLHHVTGDITSSGGMVYQSRGTQDPRKSNSFHSKDFLGYTDKRYYPSLWDALLKSLPTPPQQKAFNIATLRTEQFKTKDPLTFYSPGETREPLVKCTEWTEQVAIPSLIQYGYIWDEQTTAESSSKSKSKPKDSKHRKTGVSSKKGSGSAHGKGKATADAEWEWDDEVQGHKYWNAALQTFVFWDEEHQAEKYESVEGWRWVDT